MNAEKGKTKTGRRAFLRNLAAVGGVAAVATSAAAEPGAGTRPAPTAAKPRGYRVTPHVAKYYDKARI